jgi:hypothetical protein
MWLALVDQSQICVNSEPRDSWSPYSILGYNILKRESEDNGFWYATWSFEPRRDGGEPYVPDLKAQNGMNLPKNTAMGKITIVFSMLEYL